MKIRHCQDGEISFFNTGGDFLQSVLWAKLKQAFAWQPLFFALEEAGETLYLLVLKRKLKGPFSFAYVPHAPLISSKASFSDLAQISILLKPFLGMECLFIRYDLPAASCKYSLKNLKKAAVDVQPPDTVILDLSPNEKELLASMHKKWRYNIRLAGKKNVLVKEVGSQRLSEWYALYEETAARDKITIHPFQYYQMLFDIIEKSDQQDIKIKLLFAEHDNELLAGIIVLLHPRCSVYLYGASSSKKRNLMPNYALQWLAIQLSKEHGSNYYDFFGIPPTDDPMHPMHGLYRFKTGFGGEIYHYGGCWDFIYSSFFYFIFRSAEKLRYWYFKVFRKC